MLRIPLYQQNTTKCGKLDNRLWPVISIVSHIINVALWIVPSHFNDINTTHKITKSQKRRWILYHSYRNFNDSEPDYCRNQILTFSQSIGIMNETKYGTWIWNRRWSWYIYFLSCTQLRFSCHVIAWLDFCDLWSSIIVFNLFHPEAIYTCDCGFITNDI